MGETAAFGRILSSNIRECVVGYRVSEVSVPAFGSLVRIPVGSPATLDIYGVVTDIQIEEDGFLRQLAANEAVAEEVMLDARVNRNVPVVLRILFVGCSTNGELSHLLPPRPPLSLDAIYQCSPAETATFTAFGSFGYLRHMLRAVNVPAGELLAVHIHQAAIAQFNQGNHGWTERAIEEIIYLMRDQYAEITAILGAIGDADISLDLKGE